MEFAQDIWGIDWSPCPDCPHPTPGACPSRRHRALCEHRRTSPTAFDTLIAAEPAETREPARRGVISALRWPGPDGRLRVGFVLPGWLLGGVEMWHLTLWEHLDPGRIQVVGLVVTNPGNVDPAMLTRVPLAIPVGLGREHVGSLASTCDVLHYWDDPRVSPPPKSRAKILGTVHGEARCPFTVEWMDRLAPACGGIVAVSRSAAEAVPPEHRDTMRVIPNGVDPARVVPSPGVTREGVHAAWGVPAGATVVGYLGRLAIEDKRADLLPAASRHLPDGYHAVVVGDGYAAERVAAATSDPARTHFVPPVERPGDALVGFDWLVNPSVHEGFGLSLCEAWHAGVPVVATPRGIAAAHPELVRLIDATATPEDLAAAIRADAADPAGTRARATMARAVALDLYSAERMGREWSDYLWSLTPSPLPEPPEPPKPSLFRMAANYLVSTARHAAGGFPGRTPAAIEGCTRVCRQGAGLRPDQAVNGHCAAYRPSDDSCSDCGCPVEAKATRAGDTCPRGHWPEVRDLGPELPAAPCIPCGQAQAAPNP